MKLITKKLVLLTFLSLMGAAVIVSCGKKTAEGEHPTSDSTEHPSDSTEHPSDSTQSEHPEHPQDSTTNN